MRYTGSEKSKQTLKTIAIVIGVLLFISLVAGLLAPVETEEAKKPQPAPVQEQKKVEPKKEPEKAKYEAEVVNYTPIDPATLRVFINVKNVSKVPGKFNCFIQGTNSSGTYKGYDTFEANEELKPGKELYTYGDITVTKEGAAYVTDVTVDCSN